MSGNFLNARPLDSRGSDALSDVPDSETGTSVSGRTSWDSREELRDLVTILGLQKVEDLYQERFRVDRKKLEHMLLGKFSILNSSLFYLSSVIFHLNCLSNLASLQKIELRQLQF